MLKTHIRSLFTALCVAGTLVVLPAEAGVIVHVVQNNPNPNDATVVPPSTLPSADFFAPEINFLTATPETTSLATFFNHPTFFNEQNGFDPNGMADNLFVRIATKVSLNAGVNKLVVGHDDGLFAILLTVPPAVLDERSVGRVPETFFINVSLAGDYDLVLQYAACCDGFSGLFFTINDQPPGVPEPATAALLASGLAGAIAVRRRQSRARDR